MKNVKYKVVTPILEANDLNELQNKVSSRITREIQNANKAGKLKQYLELIRCDDFLDPYNVIYTEKAKILVVGRSTIDADIMRGIAKELGMDPERLDFWIDYKKLPNVNIDVLWHNTNYSDLIWGPTPHSMEGKEDYDSAYAKILHNSADFPKLIKAKDSHNFKITRNSFEQALKQTQYYKKEIKGV